MHRAADGNVAGGRETVGNREQLFHLGLDETEEGRQRGAEGLRHGRRGGSSGRRGRPTRPPTMDSRPRWMSVACSDDELRARRRRSPAPRAGAREAIGAIDERRRTTDPDGAVARVVAVDPPGTEIPVAELLLRGRVAHDDETHRAGDCRPSAQSGRLRWRVPTPRPRPGQAERPARLIAANRIQAHARSPPGPIHSSVAYGIQARCRTSRNSSVLWRRAVQGRASDKGEPVSPAREKAAGEYQPQIGASGGARVLLRANGPITTE